MPSTDSFRNCSNTYKRPKPGITGRLLDDSHRLTSTIGELTDVTSEEQCLQIGIWAAKEYQKLSGVKTIQAPTRSQAEQFINAPSEEMSKYLSKGRRLIDFIRMIGGSNQEEETTE
ncbi:hypothetical protein KC946_02310 [Candidatus Saccharibacteria bacterium]|nr:hypothetical protein [Candidatus Saccharibacteria bacterium]